MSVKSLRSRPLESTNIWPGFVDILATLLIVIIFILNHSFKKPSKRHALTFLFKNESLAFKCFVQKR